MGVSVGSVLARRLGLVLALAGFAQSADAQDDRRGYVEAIVGTARAIETDSAYAGLGAWRLNSRVQIVGEAGRMRNAIGRDLTDRLAAIKAAIVATNTLRFGTAFPVVFEARVPAWYGLGGVRVEGPPAGALSTYLEGLAGPARLDPQVHLTVNGENLDGEVDALTGLGEGRQQLEFLAGVGGGAAWNIRRIRIEAGYRYMRLFGDAKTNINRVHLGAGWTF